MFIQGKEYYPRRHLNEMSRLQYNVSIGCWTIWRNNREVTDVYFRRYGKPDMMNNNEN